MYFIIINKSILIDEIINVNRYEKLTMESYGEISILPSTVSF